MKILSPSHGKSLIIPTSNPQIIKQIQEQRSTPTKQINQVVTQQLLQTIAAQQKQILVQKQSSETTENSQEKIKVSFTNNGIQLSICLNVRFFLGTCFSTTTNFANDKSSTVTKY